MTPTIAEPRLQNRLHWNAKKQPSRLLAFCFRLVDPHLCSGEEFVVYRLGFLGRRLIEHLTHFLLTGLIGSDEGCAVA